MFDKSSWAFVDPLTVHQAACLWVDIDPTSVGPFDRNSRIAPILQLISGGFQSGEFSSDPTNSLERIGEYGKSCVTRTALQAFAVKRSMHPTFLFDIAMPNEDISQQDAGDINTTAKSKGGRPPEFDWDAMLGEVLRIADSDELPEKQAAMVTQILQWFEDTYQTQPSVSNVKLRISKLYGLWRTAKSNKDRNV